MQNKIKNIWLAEKYNFCSRFSKMALNSINSLFFILHAELIHYNIINQDQCSQIMVLMLLKEGEKKPTRNSQKKNENFTD